MITVKFYKEDTEWFLDLPDGRFDKLDLQMVAGADNFCEILSQGEYEVYVTLSTTPFEGCDILDLLYIGRLEHWEMGEGAWYSLDYYADLHVSMSMWLCNITKYVLDIDYFPEKIYFK